MCPSYFPLLIALICLTIIFGVKCGPSPQNNHVDLSCMADGDCAYFTASELNAFSFCINGECECFTKSNTTIPCFPNKDVINNKIGGKCPCTIPHTECKSITSTCECVANFYPIENGRQCAPVISKLNAICAVDENCQRTEVYATCKAHQDGKGKVCQCTTGFIMHNDTCFSQLGGSTQSTSCQSNAECRNITANSTCIEGECVCRTGFVSRHDANVCEPEISFASTCVDTRQCLRASGLGSVCTNETCLCQDGYNHHAIESVNGTKVMCVREIEFMSACTNHIQCIAENEDIRSSMMECRGGKCRCKSNYDYNGSICISKADTDSSQAKAISNAAFLPALAILIWRMVLH